MAQVTAYQRTEMRNLTTTPCLGSKGYVVRRAKGKGASGFVAQKVI